MFSDHRQGGNHEDNIYGLRVSDFNKLVIGKIRPTAMGSKKTNMNKFP